MSVVYQSQMPPTHNETDGRQIMDICMNGKIKQCIKYSYANLVLFKDMILIVLLLKHINVFINKCEINKQLYSLSLVKYFNSQTNVT